MAKSLEDIRNDEKAIDEVLETLYAIDVQEYHLPKSVLKKEAMNRIGRTLERLSEHKRDMVRDHANYRLEQFEKFQGLPEKKRNEIISLARQKHISIEEAYMLAGGK